MKKLLLKASLVWWKIFVATVCAIVFIKTADEVMSPVAAATFSMLLGGGYLASLGLYIYRLNKREGFEFGRFLARRKGFWLIFFGIVGMALFSIGCGWFLAPQMLEQQLGKNAMPFAAILIILFWFSLILTFLCFAVAGYAESIGYLRIRDFECSAGIFATATFSLGLSTLSCWLFLGVINDTLLSLSESIQHIILCLFALAVLTLGIFAGRYQDLEKLLSKKENRDT